MGLKKTLLSGIVAFVVATVVVRAVASERTGTKVGLLAGLAVAVRSAMSRDDGEPVEIATDEVAAE
ncbi:hypothetical protein NGM10_04290 [Halorussus salilacus]|uniref:hypothetical protein n=1 Tax=Halorussus salilacus TaxID=2953750 RepID=UPI00209E46DE|nr:hypothetical protein [Halorussus salilacus]USZ68960.1 hypothetical protein NGM10_04290 [Halorussus salilacus]